MPQVFIAYSRKELPFVEQLAADLKTSGFDVWFDVSGLGGGSRWGAEIETAIKNSQFVLVVLSPESTASEWVEREIILASNLKRKIIPLLLRTTDIPLMYVNLQHIDVREEKYQQNFADILRALKADPSTISVSALKKKKSFTLPRTEYVVAIIGALATIIGAFIPSILKDNSVPIPTYFPAIGISSALTPTILIEETSTPLDVPLLFTATLTRSGTLTPTSFPNEILDSKGVQLVLVPGGFFTMGSDNAEDNEAPAHQVALVDYYIDKFEVTNVLYRVCVKAGACRAQKSIDSASHGSYSANVTFDNFPAIYVDWSMAKAYCTWRGNGTRLPTEAEWEKAARGDTFSAYPWGEDADCSYANFWSAGGNCNEDTVQVGSYEAGISPYGVYDMAGNVWEWVADWYQRDYYIKLIEDVFNPLGPSVGDSRVLRGGSWLTGPDTIRSSNRSKNVSTSYNYDVGFRCVVDAKH